MTSVTDSPDHAESPTHPGRGSEPTPLADALLRALDRTGYGWLRRVAVAAEGGSVVLQGRVPSYYLKQLAQEAVLAVPGVEVLRNELQVEGGSL